MTTPDTAVPRLVVVDDTDASIQYSPSSAFSKDSAGKLNGQGYGGPVFNRTLTGLSGTSNNGSLSYSFNGTFVRAMVAAEGIYGWYCNVDDHLITSFTVDTSQVTNYIACDSEGTLSGTTSEHTLVVNFFFYPDSPSTSSLWLDSIHYQPLPSNPLDAVTLRVHNSDPSVTYSNSSGGWSFQGLNSNATDLTGTSMSLAFNGTSATLYSVNFGSPTEYNATTAFYTLDGKSTDFDLPGSTTTANSGGNFTNISNWPLFTVPNLSASQHNLNVATSYNSTPYPQYLSIEYFIIQTNPANSSSTEGSSNSTGVGSGSGESSSHSTPVGAIVGGVVGGVVGLAAIILAIFFFRRRRSNAQYHSAGMLDLSSGAPLAGHYGPDSAGLIINSPPPMQSASSSDHPSSFFPDALYHDETSPQQSPSVVSNVRPESTAGSSTRASQAGFDPGRLVSMKNAQSSKVRDEQLRRSELRLHTDSGVRLPPPNEREVIDVPPTYTED
ncbi:hypothetical protein J3R30DRAFT_1802031 [Lentinula aciculospora]|uniref:Uncharacterized protein n=1 Tax=Lentinula aciculospora TaxID=153920 RepID=A0A9W9DS57_9AGAR|nr:hypothetical protein J3R30DRAFT_1802031 [Lentinula aciculospora]